MHIVDVGVFAYNEQDRIENLINDLDKQLVFNDAQIKIRLRILCNGCTDDTVNVAYSAISKSCNLNNITTIDDFADGGKALTWNKFIESLHEDSQFLIFIDGDIRIKEKNAIYYLIDDLIKSKAYAVTSRPLKDLRSLQWNPLLAATATLIGRKHQNGSIAGSFYAARSDIIKQIRLPVPCLVEDGFLAACLITGIFMHESIPDRIRSSSKVSHYFSVPGCLRDFYKHDVRLSLGCELNAALYTDLWSAKTKKEKLEILILFSKSLRIDQCIEEHIKHPERSALTVKLNYKNIFEKDRMRFYRKIIRLPFQFAHILYMRFVIHSARRLFLKKRFKW